MSWPIRQAAMTSSEPLPPRLAKVWFSWAKSPRPLLPALVCSCPAGMGSVSLGGWPWPGQEDLDSGGG